MPHPLAPSSFVPPAFCLTPVFSSHASSSSSFLCFPRHVSSEDQGEEMLGVRWGGAVGVWADNVCQIRSSQELGRNLRRKKENFL